MPSSFRETESGSPYCGFGVVAHPGGNDSDSALPRFFQFPTELRLECGPLHKSVRWPEYCTISASANTCFVDNSIQARNNPRHLLAIEEKRYAVRPPAVVELCTRGVECHCGAELEIGRSPDFPLAQPNCWLIANKGAMYAAEYQTDWVIFQTKKANTYSANEPELFHCFPNSSGHIFSSMLADELAKIYQTLLCEYK
ncbi:hypothetical protein B0H14DRAFT_2560533 [Mycena olivaceomarginata]|nr:hypothetical protein B0H14DRAFT_2560533 [Mycena olivaceomarginata]